MPTYPVRALVLRKTKLGETDVIVTMLTADGEQMRAVAKGMRKPGSKLGGRLEPYSVVDLLVYKGRSLDIVTEAETVDSHSGLREDFERSTAAAVVADVLDKSAVEGQAEARLFGLADATLTALEDAPYDRLVVLVVAFLVKVMAMQGYRPHLDRCVSCGGTAVGGRFFSLSAGGVLCPGCVRGVSSPVRFSEEGRRLLVEVLGARMADIAHREQPFGVAEANECFVLLRDFVMFHMSARLRALDFYAGMLRKT